MSPPLREMVVCMGEQLSPAWLVRRPTLAIRGSDELLLPSIQSPPSLPSPPFPSWKTSLRRVPSLLLGDDAKIDAHPSSSPSPFSVSLILPPCRALAQTTTPRWHLDRLLPSSIWRPPSSPRSDPLLVLPACTARLWSSRRLLSFAIPQT